MGSYNKNRPRERWLRGELNNNDSPEKKDKNLGEFAGNPGKMELKLATIKCEKCKQEGYIESWKVGLTADGKLARLCPNCNHEQIIK